MDGRSKLKELYPNCWVWRNERGEYIVYSSHEDDKIILGYGNNYKNAYNNAYHNCTK